MITVDDSTTLGDAFFRATAAYGPNGLLAVPANPARAYSPQGREISYSKAAEVVRSLMERYRAAGYGLSHRVGLFLESQPEHLLHKLALNALGVCCVPVNPDYRPRELAYLIDHSRVDLMVVLRSRVVAARAALAQASHQPPIAVLEELSSQALPAPSTAVAPGMRRCCPRWTRWQGTLLIAPQCIRGQDHAWCEKAVFTPVKVR